LPNRFLDGQAQFETLFAEENWEGCGNLDYGWGYL